MRAERTIVVLYRADSTHIATNGEVREQQEQVLSYARLYPVKNSRTFHSTCTERTRPGDNRNTVSVLYCRLETEHTEHICIQ